MTDSIGSEVDDFYEEDDEEIGDRDDDQPLAGEEMGGSDMAFEAVLPEGASNDDELQILETHGQRLPKSPPPPDFTETIPLELIGLDPQMEKFIDERMYALSNCF